MSKLGVSGFPVCSALTLAEHEGEDVGIIFKVLDDSKEEWELVEHIIEEDIAVLQDVECEVNTLDELEVD